MLINWFSVLYVNSFLSFLDRDFNRITNRDFGDVALHNEKACDKLIMIISNCGFYIKDLKKKWKSYSLLLNAFEPECIISRKFITYAAW